MGGLRGSQQIKGDIEMEGLKYKESYEERFVKFVEELEKLSRKYGICIQSVGGVYDLDGDTFLGYTKDPTSGDLMEITD